MTKLSVYHRRLVPSLVLPLVLLLGALAAPPLSAQSELTVDEAIRLALDGNRELVDARLELEAAHGLVREAWGSVFPRLDLTSSYMRNLTVPATFMPAIFFDPDASADELVPVRFGADNQWQFQISAEQPLFQAEAFLGVGAADRYRALQTEAVRGRAQDVATRARIAYYDVLLAEEGHRLSSKSLARIEQTLDETRALHRAGLASEYDVLRLDVERSNMEPNVRRARNALTSARRALAIELGLPPVDTLRVRGSLTTVDLDALIAGGPRGAAPTGGAATTDMAPAASEEHIQRALRARSDLRQLQLMAELRRTELRVEQVGYLPKVTLFGNYQINAQQSGDLAFFGESSAQRAYGRQVGVRVTVPLFAGMQRPARIDQKRAGLERAVTQHRLASAQAEAQVRALVDGFEEARRRAEAQRFAVSQAERGFAIATAQYREGIGSQLEVTDAELALRQSEFNFAEAVYDYLVAGAQLDRATGAVPFVDTGAGASSTILGAR